jgi:predicted MFS family arabinose efflux permease
MALKLINVKENTKKKFDLSGSILITLKLTLLILLFNALESNSGIESILVYFTGFCLLLLVWIKIETKVKNPIVSIRVIKLPETLMTNAVSILSGTVIYILITASMLRIQQPSFPGLSETPLMAGLVLVPFSVATLISRYITLNHLSSYTKALVGSIFLFLSIIAFMIINREIIFEFICMALCGYGIGLIFGAIPHIIKDNLNKSDAAEAFSLNQISRSVGYSIGSVISVNIISSFFLNHAGEPSKSSYMLLAIIGLIIILLLFTLIIFCYKRFDRQAKSSLPPSTEN